jgi:hypothetical protein
MDLLDLANPLLNHVDLQGKLARVLASIVNLLLRYPRDLYSEFLFLCIELWYPL